MPVEAGDQSPMSAPNIYMNHSDQIVVTVILVEKSELDGIAKYVATRIFELVLHATQSHQNE